jgi:pimeloyl-ACP methyl ester carboxylesterase
VQHPAIDRSGGAAAFLTCLEQEIIPLVDRTYRTDPADRGLLGHSLGGLFALYTLIERPGLFQRIVSASPAADWDHSVLLGRARTALKGFPRPVRLDLSAGDEPDVIGHNITGSTAAFAALLDELKPANLEHRYTYFPGENHNSIRPASFPAGLYWVYRQAGPATDATATITAMLQEFLAKNSERAQHDRFWADDLVYTGSGAAVRTKAEIMKNFDEDKNAAGKPRNPAATYSAEDILVRPYGSAAALTFRLVAHNPDGTVQYYRNSGTLLLRNDRWQVVTWQATLVPAAASKP